MDAPTPALDEAIHRYRSAIREHRKDELLDEVHARTLSARKHRMAVRWLERGLNREIANPPVQEAEA